LQVVAVEEEMKVVAVEQVVIARIHLIQSHLVPRLASPSVEEGLQEPMTAHLEEMVVIVL
jgi:hypothetical protein